MFLGFNLGLPLFFNRTSVSIAALLDAAGGFGFAQPNSQHFQAINAELVPANTGDPVGLAVAELPRNPDGTYADATPDGQGGYNADGLGPEIQTSDLSTWTVEPGWTESGNVLTCDGTNAANASDPNSTVMPANSLCLFEYNIVAYTSGGLLSFNSAGSFAIPSNSTGLKSVWIYNSGAARSLTFQSSLFVGSFSTPVLRQVLSPYAYQDTANERPTLRADGGFDFDQTQSQHLKLSNEFYADKTAVAFVIRPDGDAEAVLLSDNNTAAYRYAIALDNTQFPDDPFFSHLGDDVQVWVDGVQWLKARRDNFSAYCAAQAAAGKDVYVLLKNVDFATWVGFAEIGKFRGNNEFNFNGAMPGAFWFNADENEPQLSNLIMSENGTIENNRNTTAAQVAENTGGALFGGEARVLDGGVWKWREHNEKTAYDRFDTTGPNASQNDGEIVLNAQLTSVTIDSSGGVPTPNCWIRRTNVALSSQGTWRYGAVVRKGSADWVSLEVQALGSLAENSIAWFDLANGAVGQKAVDYTDHGIERIDSTTFFAWVEFEADTADLQGNFYVRAGDADGSSQFPQDGSVVFQAGGLTLHKTPMVNAGTFNADAPQYPSLPVGPWQVHFAKGAGDLTKAGWTTINGVSVGNKVSGPDGGLSADELTFGASAISLIFRNDTPLKAGVGYTVAAAVRAKSGTKDFRLRANDGGANYLSDDLEASTQWQEFTFDFTAAQDAPTGQYSIANGSLGGAGEIEVYGLRIFRSDRGGVISTDFDPDAPTTPIAASYMWQDDTGQTAVIDDQDPVQMILSKEQLTVPNVREFEGLGANLITDLSVSNLVVSGGVAVANEGGALRVSFNGGFGLVRFESNTAFIPPNGNYLISFDLVENNITTPDIQIQGSNLTGLFVINSSTATGTHSFIGRTGAPAAFLQVKEQSAGATDDILIRNIKVEPLNASAFTAPNAGVRGTFDAASGLVTLNGTTDYLQSDISGASGRSDWLGVIVLNTPDTDFAPFASSDGTAYVGRAVDGSATATIHANAGTPTYWTQAAQQSFASQDAVHTALATASQRLFAVRFDASNAAWAITNLGKYGSVYMAVDVMPIYWGPWPGIWQLQKIMQNAGNEFPSLNLGYA